MKSLKFLAVSLLAGLAVAGCNSISGHRGGSRGFDYAEMSSLTGAYHKELNTLNITVKGDKSQRRAVECHIRNLTRSINSAFAGLRSEWRTEMLRECSVNAALINDGTFIVSNCLPAAIGNQDETAYVIAHVMAHSLLEHDNERATRILKEPISAAGGLSDFKTSVYLRSPDNFARFSNALGLIIDPAHNEPYTEAQERDADAIALKIMATSGYNPSAILVFWHNANRNPDMRAEAFARLHPHSDSYLKEISAGLEGLVQVYRTSRKDYGRVPQCQF
ncbi:M48 family metalloprotease [Succinimonas amylolytica]|uniref:M48 family metalloprotease n=1 Tax=Succinimonas amylolytica TaxID=83769 RepID=UPI0003770657|nr:M48 family metalloprotease [Succinimonas amylolytica]